MHTKRRLHTTSTVKLQTTDTAEEKDRCRLHKRSPTPLKRERPLPPAQEKSPLLVKELPKPQIAAASTIEETAGSKTEKLPSKHCRTQDRGAVFECCRIQVREAVVEYCRIKSREAAVERCLPLQPKKLPKTKNCCHILPNPRSCRILVLLPNTDVTVTTLICEPHYVDSGILSSDL